MESTATVAQVLQIVGWLLTVCGQVQIGMQARRGFITWIAANAVLIVLCALVGLWWSIGMYVTNMGVCIWSYRRWKSSVPLPFISPPMQPNRSCS